MAADLSHEWLLYRSAGWLQDLGVYSIGLAYIMVSTPSLPSAAHELADSILLTDKEAERFLQKFPLVHILE